MEKDSAISRCKGLSLSREFLPLSPLHHLAGEFNLVVVDSHSKKSGFSRGPVRKADEDDENVCAKCTSAFPAFGKAAEHSGSHEVS